MQVSVNCDKCTSTFAADVTDLTFDEDGCIDMLCPHCIYELECMIASIERGDTKTYPIETLWDSWDEATD